MAFASRQTRAEATGDWVMFVVPVAPCRGFVLIPSILPKATAPSPSPLGLQLGNEVSLVLFYQHGRELQYFGWVARHGRIDISENDCRDVALLRLYKGFRQRIINFWRCLMCCPRVFGFQ